MDLLSGVRVLESAQLFNGDTLVALLGDLRADVIKNESPFRGDYLHDFLGQVTAHNSPAHLQVNKNKRSIALDLRTQTGKGGVLEAVQKIIETRSQAEWVRLSAEHDLAIGPALQQSELRSDPQLAARGAFIDTVHPVAGPFTHVTLPALVNGERSAEILYHAPALGEQTDEVLAEIGLAPDDIAALRDAGVVGAPTT